jgi:predicted phosphodiesterase
MEFPEAIVAGALTSHGVTWGSLTPRLRDIAVKGHLPRKEIERVSALFAKARPEQAKIMVVHHNVLRGDLSRRMGLARWRTAQTRILESGADLVLCGHDHQEQIELLEKRVVVSCAGTLSTRSRGNRPSTFHRVVLDTDSIQVELFRWEAANKVFRRTDVFAFARSGPVGKKNVAPVVG